MQMSFFIEDTVRVLCNNPEPCVKENKEGGKLKRWGQVIFSTFSSTSQKKAKKKKK